MTLQKKLAEVKYMLRMNNYREQFNHDLAGLWTNKPLISTCVSIEAVQNISFLQWFQSKTFGSHNGKLKHMIPIVKRQGDL